MSDLIEKYTTERVRIERRTLRGNSNHLMAVVIEMIGSEWRISATVGVVSENRSDRFVFVIEREIPPEPAVVHYGDGGIGACGETGVATTTKDASVTCQKCRYAIERIKAMPIASMKIPPAPAEEVPTHYCEASFAAICGWSMTRGGRATSDPDNVTCPACKARLAALGVNTGGGVQP